MLQILINGEALELIPGTTITLEETNPFLQFNNEIQGTYSFPFDVRNSPTNNRLLNYLGTWQKVNDGAGVDAVLIDNGLQIASGKIKVERPVHHLNNQLDGQLSCYFLGNISSFQQDIKGVKLRDINVGGVRSFAGTDASPWYDSTFGQHVLNVAKGITVTDYTFFPVKNESWGLDPGVLGNDGDVMNKVYQTASGMTIGPILVPFPYLKYVLVQAIAHVGWTIEGDILDDADFERVVMINFRAIDWANFREGGGITYFLDPYATVSFDLKNHLPDITIGEFLVALKNRFAWWYDVDHAGKKITIRQLSTLTGGNIKDLTSYCDPAIPKPMIPEGRIYALRNNFVTNGGEGIDISKLNYQGALDDIAALPAASSTLNEHVYLIEEENNYYCCLQDPDDDTIWRWEIISFNIYDYVPTGATDDITTMATTVGMVKYSDYMDFIPQCEGTGVWKDFDGETSWGIHLAFWIGFGDRKLGASGGFAYKFPQASHHIYSTLGTQFAQWSLAFKGQKNDGTQVGLYDLSWKDFLSIINTREEPEIVLYLPIHMYMQLKWEDKIVIDGVKLFMKTKSISLPYRNRVAITCTRVL